MPGYDYLSDIQTNLKAGRRQHRKGQNLLRAFGYVRRMGTAIDEINETLTKLGLATSPPITPEMPLDGYIVFSLKSEDDDVPLDTVNAIDASDSDDTTPPLEDDDSVLPEPTFTVAELASANVAVECISPNESINCAYTKMALHKYSQLVVANRKDPREHDIKGIVSFQSIAKALMNGAPETVSDCMDSDFRSVKIDHHDLRSVVGQLSEKDVVLVIGKDNRLQGIITAWDLADEFVKLVDPFKRIEEIEGHLRILLAKRLGNDKVVEFINRPDSGSKPITEISELTMGGLQSVLESKAHWDELNLVFDRVVFIHALNEVRDYRNRLMHFRDPLNDNEMTQLANFCDMVREIQL